MKKLLFLFTMLTLNCISQTNVGPIVSYNVGENNVSFGAIINKSKNTWFADVNFKRNVFDAYNSQTSINYGYTFIEKNSVSIIPYLGVSYISYNRSNLYNTKVGCLLKYDKYVIGTDYSTLHKSISFKLAYFI